MSEGLKKLTRQEAEASIDRFIHDAEHAEAGAKFAQMMADQQPGNPDHPKYEKELREKAVSLRAQAKALADEHHIEQCPKCGSADIDFDACRRCAGVGGHMTGNGFDEPREMDPCDECGGTGGKYNCYSCEHAWEREPTDKEVEDRLEAAYDYDD